MDTIRRRMIWAGGVLACILAVVIDAQAADSVRAKVESNADESAVILLGDVRPDRLIPLPDTYTVKRRYPDGHPMQNALAGTAESCALEEIKEIYSAKLGQFLFRPSEGQPTAGQTNLPDTFSSFFSSPKGGKGRIWLRSDPQDVPRACARIRE